MVKSIKCPHCRRVIKDVRRAHDSPAVKMVLDFVGFIGPFGRGTHIKTLAGIYMRHTPGGLSERSARKAIERLAKDGYLRRVRAGMYVVRKK